MVVKLKFTTEYGLPMTVNELVEKTKVDMKGDIDRKIKEFANFLDRIFRTYYYNSVIYIIQRSPKTKNDNLGLVKTGKTVSSIKIVGNKITIEHVAGLIELGTAKQPAREVVKRAIRAYFGDNV